MHRVLALVIPLLLVGSARAATPRSFTVEVTGSGPPVVLIPGLACSGAVWSSTVARYRGSHQLHVLTLAGFGGTKAIDGPLLPTVRVELAAYLREHKLPRAIIVGHSLGGFLALWLAATEPELVGGVVVVDAVPFLPALMTPGATVETAKPQAEMMRSMIAQSTPESFAAQNRASLAFMITDPKNIEPVAAMGRSSNPKSVATAMYELMTTDLRPLLHSVRAPTLVLAATSSDEAKAYEAQYASLKDHRLLVAEHARHFIMIDDPAFFFSRLDEALTKNGKQ